MKLFPLALLVTTSLVLVGCSHQPQPLPSIETKTEIPAVKNVESADSPTQAVDIATDAMDKQAADLAVPADEISNDSLEL